MRVHTLLLSTADSELQKSASFVKIFTATDLESSNNKTAVTKSKSLLLDFCSQNQTFSWAGGSVCVRDCFELFVPVANLP